MSNVTHCSLVGEYNEMGFPKIIKHRFHSLPLVLEKCDETVFLKMSNVTHKLWVIEDSMRLPFQK